MWSCPLCSRSFANANQWHACTDVTLDEHLAATSALARELFAELVAVVERCGPFRFHPAKTRVAFITEMSFAGAVLSERWIDVSMILPEWIDDDGFRRITVYGPTSFGHTARVVATGAIEPLVGRWACLAYRRGLREQFPAFTIEGDPRERRTADRLRVPLKAHVAGDELRLPDYVASVIGDTTPVVARIGSDEYRVALERGVHGVVLPVSVERPVRSAIDVELRLEAIQR